jgi:hypothetical protein
LLGLDVEMRLGFEPSHYARQIRAGLRRGLYALARDYVEALRVHVVGVGESGTPYFAYAPLLHDQLFLEYVTLLEDGLYGTQYVFGPAVDTRGWAKGPLAHHLRDDGEINPSGIVTATRVAGGIGFEPRAHPTHGQPWVRLFLGPLFRDLRELRRGSLRRP